MDSTNHKLLKKKVSHHAYYGTKIWYYLLREIQSWIRELFFQIQIFNLLLQERYALLDSFRYKKKTTSPPIFYAEKTQSLSIFEESAWSEFNF